MHGTRLTYVPALDGLRAVAIVFVVLYHSIPSFDAGMTGVDVFFVLSGFLITALIAVPVKNGTFSRRHFYLRRAIRLVPALVVTVLVFTPIALVVVTGQPTWLGAIGALLYISPFVPATIFGHTWSLAIEEWFYLWWPLVLARCFRDRLTLRQIAFLVGVLALAGQLAMVRGPGAMIARPSALEAGVALGLWWIAGGRLSRPNLALAGGAGLIVAGPLVGTVFYGPLPFWMAVLGAVLFIAGLMSGGQGSAKRGLETPALVAIGVVSYEWYLLHFPTITIADGLWGPGSAWLAAPLSLGMAFALHRALVPVQSRLRARLDARLVQPA